MITSGQFHDLLAGFSVGDAFGAGVEFQDRDWIRQNVDFTQFVNARNQIQIEDKRKALFTDNYRAWDYTDDTEMTVGLVKALMETSPFTEELLVRKWKEEYAAGIRAKGYGRNGHGSMGWYYRGEKSIEDIRNFQRDRPNPGNAPAMRAVPLGLLPDELINEYAATNARATHPNEMAIIASQLVARAATYLLILQGDPAKLIAYCRKVVPLNEAYENYLSTIDRLSAYENLTDSDFITLCGPQPIVPPYFLPGINGVPSDAKFTAGCVLYVLKYSQDAMDALRKSINLGGDVDSVASITTGILAGSKGLESIPDFMLEATEKIPGLQALSLPTNK
ncbi:ADP-ribosylglycohydrolase family protein [Neolewinella persica]|uniref:ADP-ribosylglycohydrolase family protein n=1 Tax=Neolewinella persica TaxID=70998 RepID=UPI0003630C65|nr:ADP-ribosylglycohydrolase family protein [Neolewinella persica]